MRLMIPLFIFGCSHRVIRDSSAYTAEIASSLARQEAAAAALREAATKARSNDDIDACLRYIEPALRIETRAQAEAYRALWLADIPYPGGGNGDQQDPGAAPEYDDGAATSFCEED